MERGGGGDILRHKRHPHVVDLGGLRSAAVARRGRALAKRTTRVWRMTDDGFHRGVRATRFGTHVVRSMDALGFLPKSASWHLLQR